MSPLAFGMALDRRLREMPANVIILLRRPVDRRRLSITDLTASKLAEQRGIEVEWFEPEGGRGSTYDRDYELVGSADRVEAFFDSADMPGGTGHVVDAALARNRTVYAWLVAPYGELARIGDWETDEDMRYS